MDAIYVKLVMVLVTSVVIYAWLEMRYRSKMKDADKRFEQIMGALAKRYDKEQKNESKTNKDN